MVLRGFAGAEQSVFLPFLDARIAGQQAGGLERRLELAVELDQGAGDAQPDGLGLGPDAAALDRA